MKIFGVSWIAWVVWAIITLFMALHHFGFFKRFKKRSKSRLPYWLHVKYEDGTMLTGGPYHRIVDLPTIHLRALADSEIKLWFSTERDLSDAILDQLAEIGGRGHEPT